MRTDPRRREETRPLRSGFSRGRGLSAFGMSKMSLLFEKPGNPEWPTERRIVPILLFLAFVGRLIGHIAAPVALIVCYLTRAFLVGTGLAARSACRLGLPAPLALRPALEPQVEVRVYLPDA